MKKLILFSLGLITVLSSCVKEPAPVPVGEAKVRFVNASRTASAQDCYINDSKKNGTGLTFSGYTPYYTFTSGINSFVFTNEGSSEVNAGTTQQVPIGANYTVFFLQNAEKQSSAVIGGDDNAVVEGKAKVRFINLHMFLKNPVKVETETGTVLAAGVGVISSSAYFTVDPATKFVLKAEGIVDPVSFDPAVVAGKNYTIWFSGSSATELTAHKIIQN